MSANKMFEAKAKLSTKEQNVKPKHKPSIGYGDMEKLNKYFTEGPNNGIWRNPEKLVEFVWFSLCYHFARRGREGWRELNKLGPQMNNMPSKSLVIVLFIDHYFSALCFHSYLLHSPSAPCPCLKLFRLAWARLLLWKGRGLVQKQAGVLLIFLSRYSLRNLFLESPDVL